MFCIGDTLYLGWIDKTCTIKNIWLGINDSGSWDCLISLEGENNNTSISHVIDLMRDGDICRSKEEYDRLRAAKVICFLRSNLYNYCDRFKIMLDNDDTIIVNILRKDIGTLIMFDKHTLLGACGDKQFKDLRQLKDILGLYV